MSKDTSFQILSKTFIFEEVMLFPVFTDLQGHLPGFTKIVVGPFHEKAVTFEVKCR